MGFLYSFFIIKKQRRFGLTCVKKFSSDLMICTEIFENVNSQFVGSSDIYLRNLVWKAACCYTTPSGKKNHQMYCFMRKVLIGCGEFTVELWPRNENFVLWLLKKHCKIHDENCWMKIRSVICCYLQPSGIMHSQFLQLFSNAKIYL